MNLDPLFQPLNIGSVTLKNRVVLAAHAINQSTDNIMGQASFDYYEERARGGVGLIITEAQVVHVSGKGGAPMSQQGWDPRSVSAYEKLADVAHRHGAKVFCDLAHMGPMDSNTLHLDNYRGLFSPSGVAPLSSYELPKAMERADLDAVKEGFVTTAMNAKTAGLDGVEVHAAHGFLLSSFLSPSMNKRTDEYGGSTANRCRYVLEVAQAIRDAVGDDFPIGLRFNFEEFLADGIDEKEGERILATVDEPRLFDYFSITGGVIMTVTKQISPMGEKRGLLEPYAAAAKRLLDSRVPVIAANRITSVEHAAELIESGVTDLVAMVRAHMADPALVSKAQAGRVEEIRECINCNQGCVSRLAKQRAITCTINPRTGREGEWGPGSLKPASTARKVVIVGAGPAGLKAAEVAAERGHEVVVFERAEQIGGSARYAAALPRRDGWMTMIDNFERTLAAAGVQVRLGTEATPDGIEAEEPDVVVLATGASFDRDGFASMLGFRPGIPNLDKTTVLDPIEAISDPDRCGQNVLIVDDSDDYLPLGLAELLAGSGKTVEVVSHHMFVGAETINTADLGLLYPRLAELGVTVSAQHLVADIEEKNATIGSIWGNGGHTFPLDSLVLTMSRSPERSLFDELDGRLECDVERIGDSVAPRHVDEAILEGERLGRTL